MESHAVPRIPDPLPLPDPGDSSITAAAKIIIEAVPVLGGMLTGIVEGVQAHVSSRTLAVWTREVAEVLKYLLEFRGRDLNDLLQDDVFCDAVARASLIAFASRREGTRRALCNALLNVGASGGSESDADLHASLLALLDSVTPSHMRALGFLEDPIGWSARSGIAPPPMKSMDAGEAPTIAGIFDSHLRSTLGWQDGRTIAEDLVTRGLVPRVGANYPGLIAIDPIFGPDREMLTWKARTFIDFIRGGFGDPTQWSPEGP